MRGFLVAVAAFMALTVALWLGSGYLVRPPSDVELKLMIWGSPDEISTVRGYVKTFRQRHPEIDVKIQHVADMGYRQKLNTRFRGGEPPDVFYVAYEDFVGVANRSWLLPLDDLIANDPEFKSSDFFPEVYEKFRYEDGKLYGVVKDFATLVVYYNKDLFDKYDVPYPKRGWTWDDFLETARKLTHAENREYGCVLETWPGIWFPWVWSSGGKILEFDGDTPRWVLGDPKYLDKNARAFQFLADLIWKHGVEPSPSVTRDQGVGDMFVTGQIGMCAYGRWKCMTFKHIKDFDWDVVEMPRLEREATTLFPVCYSIARDTKHKGASWQLLKFLTSREAQVDVANSGQAIPSMKSVAESPAFFKPAALKGLEVDARPNITSVAFADPGPAILTWQEVRETLRMGLEGLWNGTRRDARELLQELQKPLSDVVATEKQVRADARGR
ncbi:MAG: sugar ABC transporter substrate-binding protein [Planctomycetota bacterium]